MRAPILIGESGEPVWPAGLTGSISHSPTLAGAMVCKSNTYPSLGLDIETIGLIKPKHWKTIFTEPEIAYLSRLNTEDSARESTVFFTMKEAFYKLQFSCARQTLDFLDCEITGSNEGYRVRVGPVVSRHGIQPESLGIRHFILKGVVVSCMFETKSRSHGSDGGWRLRCQ